MTHKPIIGMEIHVELSTRSKMFCSCDADHFAKKPNTQTCPVCLGLPGAMPFPNKKAVQNTILIGLALNCSINNTSKFDRKHYFYPDLPKGYQISQYDKPLCKNGYLILDSGKKIRITRVHLEEDTAKLLHKKIKGKTVSLVDFNRSGVPLVEIVTKPDLETKEETKEFLKKIHHIIKTLKISNADMEKGSMRLEANISIGDKNNLPNYKVEIKNVNSFRYITNAIGYEIIRQHKLIKANKTPKQETRGWDRLKNITFSQRIKESEDDYRYFPEPDIPPLHISDTLINQIKKTLPLLPDEKEANLISQGINKKYAHEITKNEKFTQAINSFKTDKDIDINKLANYLVNKKINTFKIAEIKKQYLQLTSTGIADKKTLSLFVQQALDQNPKAITDYPKNPNSIGFLVGQVMKLSQGKASPQLVRQLLLEKLSSSH